MDLFGYKKIKRRRLMEGFLELLEFLWILKYIRRFKSM
jgi:hypothetical protein